MVQPHPSVRPRANRPLFRDIARARGVSHILFHFRKFALKLLQRQRCMLHAAVVVAAQLAADFEIQLAVDTAVGFYLVNDSVCFWWVDGRRFQVLCDFAAQRVRGHAFLE